MAFRNSKSAMLALLALGACGTVPNESRAVFAAPEKYVGQQLELCGYFRDAFEDQNVYPSRRAYANHWDTGIGLGFLPKDIHEGPGAWHDRQACARVEIVRTGCAKEMICTASSFEYAAREIGGAYGNSP